MISDDHQERADDVRILEMMGIGGPGLPSLDDVPTATHWPSLPPNKAADTWEELRDWVRQLENRFPHLDHHVIPPCWWLHNEHVEALAALRDHERVSYAATAPATSPVEWMRAFRDIEALLRAWTAEHACASAHQEPRRLRPRDESGWSEHIRADVYRRSETSLTQTVSPAHRPETAHDPNLLRQLASTRPYMRRRTERLPPGGDWRT